MTEVSIASGAEDFNPYHSEAEISFEPDIFAAEWLEKAGPASSRIKFRISFEEGEIAANAVICTVSFFLELSGAKCGFGAFVSENAVLLGSELFFPLSISFNDFIFALRGNFFDRESGIGFRLAVLRIWLGLEGIDSEGKGGEGKGCGYQSEFHVMYETQFNKKEFVLVGMTE